MPHCIISSNGLSGYVVGFTFIEHKTHGFGVFLKGGGGGIFLAELGNRTVGMGNPSPAVLPLPPLRDTHTHTHKRNTSCWGILRECDTEGEVLLPVQGDTALKLYNHTHTHTRG